MANSKPLKFVFDSLKIFHNFPGLPDGGIEVEIDTEVEDYCEVSQGSAELEVD